MSLRSEPTRSSATLQPSRPRWVASAFVQYMLLVLRVLDGLAPHLMALLLPYWCLGWLVVQPWMRRPAHLPPAP
jgi:hypothetical protein